MRSRVIGGTIYAVLFYVSLLINITERVILFDFFIIFIGVFGLIEMFNMIKRSTVKLLNLLYLFIFIYFVYSLYYISSINVALIIMFAAVIMLNDTFAYLVGKRFGKTKFSKISPNKTIEGLLGGMLIGPIFAIALIFVLANTLGKVDLFFIETSKLVNYNPFGSIIELYLFSVLLAFVGNVGDLVESFFKRKASIKDSGNIVYGHGGILDRQDSLVFVMIIVCIFIV